MTMKNYTTIILIVCLTLLIIFGLLVSSAAALPFTSPFENVTWAPIGTVENITPWYPETDFYTRYWFDYVSGTFAPYGFLQSITLPYTNIIGFWFFAILWFIFLLGVWNRERMIELTVVMMLLTGSLWGLLLPPETYWYGMALMALSIAAIVYKLYKR